MYATATEYQKIEKIIKKVIEDTKINTYYDVFIGDEILKEEDKEKILNEAMIEITTL